MKPEANQTEESVMTVEEAAKYCKVSRRTIDAAIQTRQLRCVQLGPATRRILFKELTRWLNSNMPKKVIP